MSRQLVLTLVLALAAAAPAAAETKPPATCATSISIKADRDHMKGKVTGKVAQVKVEEYWATIHLDDGAAGFDFTISPPQYLPFAKGNKVTLAYACGGGRQIMCDAQLSDSKGEVFLISAAVGTDDLSDGWTSSVGGVVKSTPDSKAGSGTKSIEHTHALVLAKGKAKATIEREKCTAIEESGTTWLASGFAIRWEGERPPEGVDYQSYSLQRWRKPAKK